MSQLGSVAKGTQDAPTFYSGPLQLIRIDDDGKCHLEDNAVSILNQIHGRLAVVGVAGLYRTGKSFLLNRLLGLQDGFEIGPTVNPCTKGLWIWGQPVQLAPDYHCILIDTEGLGSTQRTASCDMQIFSLCILLSSFFIYNSMGAIDEQAIDDLHLVSHLARHVHVKARKGSEGERTAELSHYFPIFLWVLRDFHLRLADSSGAAISEKDYLENALKSTPGQEEKNKVRDTIKELFRDRDCMTVVRPVAEEADLRNIQRLPYESLRPQFRTQVEAFVRKVYLSLKPKQIDGAFVSGTMFVNLASEYCKAINNSAVPTIQSAWTSVVQHQLRLCLKDSVQVYRAQMNDTAMQQLPLSQERLRELHKVAKAEALKIFLAPKFENDSKFRECRTELATRIKQLLDHVQAENMNMSRKQCEHVARDAFARLIESRIASPGGYRSFEQLAQDWNQCRKAYLEQSVGPAQADVLTAFFCSRMNETTQRLWEQLHGSSRSADKVVPPQLPNEGHAVSTAPLEVARKQWLVERGELERQLEALRAELLQVSQRATSEKAQMLDVEQLLRVQLSTFQERLAAPAEARLGGSTLAGGGDTGQTAAELRGLREVISSAMAEVRTLGMDRKHLELQAEHERQLIGTERKFQQQLTEARRKNEGVLETLRQSYEEEVHALRSARNDLVVRTKDLEKELERIRGECEVLRQRALAAEGERAAQQRFVETAQRQAELVTAFLERSRGRGADESQPLHDELGGGTFVSPARGGSTNPFRGAANAGNMPYASANAAVFRSVPGV